MSGLPRVLIVEDERPLALALAATLRHVGAASQLAPTAAKARRFLEAEGPFAAMILDIGLPDQNGLAFLESIPPDQRPPVFVITAHGEIDNTITARKLGVRGFFPKPLDFDAFTGALENLLRDLTLSGPGPNRVESNAESPPDAAFIGAAPAMRAVFQQIAHACASDEPVLVRGETGTGKSLVASLIGKNSRRAGASFENFLAGGDSSQSTLDASIRRAEGGTLLIEEVAALSSDCQTELVRHIERGEKGFPRLLATCLEPLLGAVDAGHFRSDLYYRLQVLEVRLPPLRERIADLPALAAYFAGQHEPGKRIGISEGALKRLGAHRWPGNLRELRNVVSYALTANAGGTRIDADHLPDYLGKPNDDTGEELPESFREALAVWLDSRMASEASPPTYRDLSETIESELARQLLERFDGKLARLASELQANRATLRRKLRR
ncbi:MAG: sigma-54-dependent Fis family transcriptional regulator [Verrucomicrobiae bacterium]|nr:sigma-54-dependent Fis family transcriptional regulator [Verrucomicrobiae bacterium]